MQGMAGNIVHAIATTNAIVSGLIVAEATKLLAGMPEKCRVSQSPESVISACLDRALRSSLLHISRTRQGGGPAYAPPKSIYWMMVTLGNLIMRAGIMITCRTMMPGIAYIGSSVAADPHWASHLFQGRCLSVMQGPDIHIWPGRLLFRL